MVAIKLRSPTCTVLLKCAKKANSNASLSLYSQFFVGNSVQPCGFRLAVVTCFVEVRVICIEFELVSIRSTLPLYRDNLMGFPKLVCSPENLEILIVEHEV